MNGLQIRALEIPPAAEAALLAGCLSEPEQRLMASHRHPRRQLEFAAGRLALKRALLEKQESAVRLGTATSVPASLRDAMQRLQILPDAEGRPKLWIDDAVVATPVSIAHAAGWAAAVCASQPIGLDIVDLDSPTAVPDDLPWLAGVAGPTRLRLRALLWGLRECLLKSGQVAAKNVWGLEGVDVLPISSAAEIAARWPGIAELAPLQVEVDGRTVAAAFLPLGPSTLLVMTLTDPLQPNVSHLSNGNPFHE